MIEINKDLNSPVRSIAAKAEVYSSAAASASGDLINIKNVYPKARSATVNKDVWCYGKNLIDYKNTAWSGGDITFNGDTVSISTTGYYTKIQFFPSQYNWIRKGTKYTFSLDVLELEESAGNPITITLVAMYEDDTYTEHNKVITAAGRHFATITTDANKEIKYFEIRPIRKGSTDTTTLTAKVKDLMLSVNDDISYERYKAPVASIDNAVVLHSPEATVIAADGTVFNIDYTESTLTNTFNHNDVLKSITIERIGESKFFGYGICQKLNIKVLDIGRSLDLTTDNYFKIYFDNINNFPDFYVSEVHRDEKTNELSITAYDALYSITDTVADLNLIAPYTIKDVLAAICSRIGGNFSLIDIPEEDTGINLSFENGANFDGTESIREVLNDIAEALQSIYYINGYFDLQIKRLNAAAAGYTIGKSSYIELESGTNRRLSTICSATDLGDNVEASLDVSGTTQYVRNNAFWELREDIDIIVDAALTAIGGLTINQFNCNWRGNYGLEIGDRIDLQTKDNNYVSSFLLADTINYNGGYSQTTSWSYEDKEKETATNSTNLGEALKSTFAKVDKANRQIDIVASEAAENTENIAALQLTTKNISASVGNINKDISNLASASMSSEDVKIMIQAEINTGVDKVITATGFTFDNEGLTVSKTGAEMTTQITEDGMKVFRDNTEVLTADNTGVKAENLHSTTYLTIGSYSRLEDYGSRTGCFWVG